MLKWISYASSKPWGERLETPQAPQNGIRWGTMTTGTATKAGALQPALALEEISKIQRKLIRPSNPILG